MPNPHNPRSRHSSPAETTAARAAEQPSPEQLARLQRRIRIALGEQPADLRIVGAQLVNVFTERVELADVLVADDTIAAVGSFESEARQTIDATGRYLLPGLIDSHMHLESTLLSPGEFARTVVPRGTAAVVADPHEVGNVLGVPGILALLRSCQALPLDYYFMAPSCVPATDWEHSGARLDAEAVAQLLDQQGILGLAEMMDFPAVLRGEAAVLRKMLVAHQRGAPVDGHAPGLAGRQLVAYVSAGIRSDHESTTCDEALAKAALGMMVQVREGSTARNLDTLLPLLVADRLGDWSLCSDDIYPDDLVRDGHLDYLLRRCVAAGVPAARAVRHATLVPARHYGLSQLGAIAPARMANLLVVDDLQTFRPREVVYRGRLVARDGEYLDAPAAVPLPSENTVHLPPLARENFVLPLASDSVPVIGVIADQINTLHEQHTVCRREGHWQFDPEADIALVATIERHRASGSMALGLVRGFGLRVPCALGSTVAHDSHNVVVVGTSPDAMLAACQRLEELGGGFVAVRDAEPVAELPLRFAGLLSVEPQTVVCQQLARLNAAAQAFGCRLASPLATLSFLALPVIPQLRLTDQGLFDVDAQCFLAL